MDYIDNTLNYIKNTLEVIKNALIMTKDIMVSVANIISTIVDILGFIGFRVFLLLITTTFILWLLNFVSPVNRKTNYFISICLVVWIAINAKMPMQVVIIKYILIIILPFFLAYCINFIVKNFTNIYKIIFNKLYSIFIKIDFQFLRNKNYNIKNGDNIGILFSSDMPTIVEIQNIKNFIISGGYNVAICEEEKIALTDNDDKIIFPLNIRIAQLIESLKSKDIKLLWFWSQFYGSDVILDGLYSHKKIIQNKFVIGCGDNSFLLNFLQERWGWVVAYGKNIKELINSSNDIDLINNIFNKTSCGDLSLVNDFKMQNGYSLKSLLVGSDLNVLISQFGGKFNLKFKNKILFFDGYFESDRVFYRAIMQLKNNIIHNNSVPKAIIFGDLKVHDNKAIFYSIEYLNNELKKNNINIPIFKINDMDYILLNKFYIIEYSNKEIKLIIV